VRRADDDTRYAIMVGVMANAFSAHSVSAIGGLRLHPLVPLRVSSSLSLPTPLASPGSRVWYAWTLGLVRRPVAVTALLARGETVSVTASCWHGPNSSVTCRAGATV